MEFELLESKDFLEQLETLAITNKDYKNFVKDIKASPRTAKGSHSLKGTLAGFRAAHIRGGKFIVIFLICEECLSHPSHKILLTHCPEAQEKCGDFKRIVLLKCGLHGFYKTFSRSVTG